MRSIGKWKIKKLNQIVKEEFDRGFQAPGFSPDHRAIRSRIDERIPAEWFDTWECAWSEIERLIDDQLNHLIYGGE